MIDCAAEEIIKEYKKADGDGNEFETDELEGEDLFGWLIPEKRADEFQKYFAIRHTWEWDKFLLHCVWRRAGSEIIPEFRIYAC